MFLFLFAGFKMSQKNVSNIQIARSTGKTCIPSLAPLNDICSGNESPNKDSLNTWQQDGVFGGFIGEGTLAWRASGPTLEILHPRTCVRKAAWTFGAIVHNTSAVVSSFNLT